MDDTFLIDYTDYFLGLFEVVSRLEILLTGVFVLLCFFLSYCFVSMLLKVWR